MRTLLHNTSRSDPSNQAAEKDRGVVLAFDMGGSHVAAMARQIGNVFTGNRVSLPLDETGSEDYLFDRIEEVSRMAFAAVSPRAVLKGIAFAVPGSFDYANGISLLQHKLSSWYGVNVRKQLALRFGIDEMNILFLNDADAFLLGELEQASASRAIGITLGTGIGAAFAINDRTVPAMKVLPNNCDLYALPWKGGIVEDFVSTRGIMKLHLDRGGRYCSVKEIAAQFSVDSIATDTMLAFGHELGSVIASYLLPFAPDIIILGGSIARSPETFMPAAISELHGHTNLLRISTHFEKAALLGSVAGWLRQHNLPV